MESYSTMCRLCLANKGNKVDLLKAGNSHEYSEQLEEVFRIEVNICICIAICVIY